MSQQENLVSSMVEMRRFEPPAEFAGAARVGSMQEYRRMWQRSIDDPEGFWGEVAQDFHWFEPWQRVLEFDAPDARWFVGGKTNLAYNCLDRIVERGQGDKLAIIFEAEPTAENGQPTRTSRISYRQLLAEVCRFANALKAQGVKKGDVVTIYMPMVPEAAVAMLACARIGAPHSVIFGGFSSQAIADRVNDADSRVIITADGGSRRGRIIELKKTVDEACKLTDKLQTVVVLRHAGNEVNLTDGRDVWWHEITAGQPQECPAEPMDAEDLAFVLYTSGSTGKPKGIMHTTGGYMAHTYLTTKYTFDIKDDDIYWCTADVGWITGHSYVVYGVMLNGGTTFMYEGAPNWPDFGRFWQIIERHDITIFYTAPTAIRAFMKAGRELVDRHDLSSLRLLGTVGEPINPEAWMWFHTVVGGEKCPIVDTWWQTETGGHMITPLPGATPTKPGTATLPFFGVDAAIVDRNGQEVPANQGGLLVIRKPWPGMLRGILGDRDRFIRTYWSEIKGVYFTGDGARRDEDGYFWIMGRIDDVLNVSGHRLGTAEIESALVAHEAVAEAAVVGVPHEVKGQGVAAFVTLKTGYKPTDELKASLVAKVASDIGALAKPDQIRFAEALPKTRSGKIMRRILKEVAAGADVKGDVTTLEDFAVVERLRSEQ